MRANIVVAVGVVGEREDLEMFMELWRQDAEDRAHRIAEQVMEGRVIILPLPEIEGEEPNGV